MKQLIQSLSNGKTIVVDLPAPKNQDGYVLIKTIYSLVSSGTERMLVDFGKSNYIDKARKQPEKVKQVLDKVNSDGLVPTLEAITNKLEQPIPLGYCNVGIIMELGKGIKHLKIGDRVISNGAHAEFVTVPHNLCSKIPKNVDNETAVFTVISSIGLNGIRLANPTFGETFLVSGLGLIGLITVQLLKANGCNVIGIDYDKNRCEIAKTFGVDTIDISSVDDYLTLILEYTKGKGVDGAIITAATQSSEPINFAAKACRKKGRIVLVGSTGIDLNRDLLYKKELSFQVSCSYGPGRYDPSYEQLGNDYPIGYVRWTEGRNFEAILDSMSKDLIKTDKLISHYFPLSQAEDAYQLLLSKQKYLGILLTYDSKESNLNNTLKLETFEGNRNKIPLQPIIGFLGAGNYASRILIPAFSKTNSLLHTIIASDGLRPYYFGRKFGFKFASTDNKNLFEDKKCNTIVIATKHDSHSTYVKKALKAKMNVFVEKPLCLNKRQLIEIKETYLEIKNEGRYNPILMVGFNRRFAPLTKLLKKYLNRMSGKKSFIYTINAGNIHLDHWIHDLNIGGGRLIGECCHFVDLLRYLVGYKIQNIDIFPLIETSNKFDTFSLQLSFEDGSSASIHYFSNGSKAYPKERLEVFCNEQVLQLDNFRKLIGWGIKGFKSKTIFKQNKGQNECVKEFINSILTGAESPIPLNQIFEVQEWMCKLNDN